MLESLPGLVFLFIAGVLAGWIDAIGGGGGLVQVPALLAGFPGVPVQALLGANKLSSMGGTVTALWRYRASGFVRLRRWWPMASWGAAGGAFGAAAAMQIPATFLRPLILALVIVVLVWMLVSSELVRSLPQRRERVGGHGQWLLGGGVGLYDGFFGPGTGSLLVLALQRWLGLDPVAASAAAKVVNLATNAGALVVFAASGSVLWLAALPLAVGNVCGGWLGATMAVRLGGRLVRGVLVCVVLLLAVKAGLESFP
ncbi:MAG: sulfite exporter TauE/SafE family protein [Betaproteobacteria bacterium]